MARYRSALQLLVKICFTGGAFYLVAQQVDWAQLQHALSTQKIGWLTVAVGLIFMQLILGALRWHRLLTALTEQVIRRWYVVRLYYASLVFNVFMPGTLGSDVSRVWMLHGKHISATPLIASVIFDRIFSLISLLVVMVIFLAPLLTLFGINSVVGIALSLVTASIGIISGIALYRLTPRIERLKRFVWLKKIIAPLPQLAKHPTALLWAMTYSIAAHLMACGVFYVLAKSLALPVTYVDCLMLVPLVMLASSIPISISGWGVRELGTTASFALIGIEPAAAVIIAVQVGVLATLLNASGGIPYLLQKHKR